MKDKDRIVGRQIASRLFLVFILLMAFSFWGLLMLVDWLERINHSGP
jgi:hypothetical protein